MFAQYDPVDVPPGLPLPGVRGRREGRHNEPYVRNTFINIEESPEPSPSPVRRRSFQKRQPRPSSCPPCSIPAYDDLDLPEAPEHSYPIMAQPVYFDTPECSPSPRNWRRTPPSFHNICEGPDAQGYPADADMIVSRRGTGSPHRKFGGDRSPNRRHTVGPAVRKGPPCLNSVFPCSDGSESESGSPNTWEKMLELASQDDRARPTAKEGARARDSTGSTASCSPCKKPLEVPINIPSDEAIAGFMQKWSLDERCERSLRSLSPRQQHEIMANFSPAEGSKNPSAKFLLWLSPRLQQVEGRPPVTPAELRQFADRWSLDDRSRRILEELPPVVQCQVVTSFDPPPGTENVDAKLLSFARLQVYRAAARGRRGKGPGTPAQERGRQPCATSPPKSAKAKRDVLTGLSHADAADQEVAPPACHPNPPRTEPEIVVPRMQEMHPLQVKSALMPAPYFMGTTAPEPCLAPLPGMHTAPPQGRWWPPPPQEAPQELPPQWCAPRVPCPAPTGFPQPQPQPQLWLPPQPPQLGPQQVRAFVARWELDEACQQALLQLPVQQQHAVMAGFNPSKKTSNVNRKFMAFCRMKLQDRLFTGGREGVAQMAPEQVAPAMWHEGFGFQGRWGQGDQTVSDLDADNRLQHDPKIHAFVERWELDADCEHFLLQLPAPQQHVVMSGFNPSKSTSNTNRKFMAFARRKLQDAQLSCSPSGMSTEPVHAAEHSDLLVWT